MKKEQVRGLKIGGFKVMIWKSHLRQDFTRMCACIPEGSIDPHL